MSQMNSLKPARDEDKVRSHLTWLVESRYANQSLAIRIRDLLAHPSARDGNLAIIQDLVGTCFSLWRAAFLADKTGIRESVFTHASSFLDEMIAHNAITYVQDRKSYEWTFNYYATNAARALYKLAEQWPSIKTVLSETISSTNQHTRSQQRWDRNHRALVEAVACFERHLDELRRKKLKKKKKKKK